MASTLRVVVASVLIGSSIAALDGCNPDSSSSTAELSSTAASAGPAASSPTSVTISWLAPDTNANGSVLTNLAGYHIHYGTSSKALVTQIDVPTSGLTNYVVDNLTPNTTYYFAVSTYNSARVESNYSPIVSVTTS